MQIKSRSFVTIPIAFSKACLVVVLGMHLIASAQDAGSVFTLDDALRLRTLHGRMPVDLSDDGRFVAFCVHSRENQSNTRGMRYASTGSSLDVASAEVWIVDREGGLARRLSGDDERAWAPRWSPDGRKLAYFSDRGGKPRLWIYERDTDIMLPVDGALVRTFFAFELPEWSPDGHFVYFKAIAKAYERYYGYANSTFPQDELPFVPARPRSERDIETGSAPTVRRSARPEVELGAVYADHEVHDARALGRGILDVARYDLRSSNVERIVRGCSLRDFDVSPDGSQIAYFVTDGNAIEAQQGYRSLFLVSTEGRYEPRLLEPRAFEGYCQSLSWSPDGTRLCYVTSGPLSDGDVILFELPSGERHNLTQDFDVNLGRGDWHIVPPLWTPAGDAILFGHGGDLWSIDVGGAGARNLTATFEHHVQDAVSVSEASSAWPIGTDGRVLAQFRSSDGARGGFASTALDGSGTEILWSLDGQILSQPRMHVDIARDTGELVVRIGSSNRPDWLHMVSPDGVVDALPGDPNEWIEDKDLGRLKVLEWKLADGRRMRGLLLLPNQDKGAAAPACVVRVYAGSRPSGQARSFPPGGGAPAVDHPALFLARGLAVFMPDLPLQGHEPASTIWEVTQPALDALQESELVDVKRLGVFGHSYGGYTVYCLLTQTDRFSAAASSAGFSNLISFYLRSAASSRGTGYFETGQGGMGASLWEDLPRYQRNSPILSADHIRTPLLILHGTEDWYYDQSEEMFGAMKRLGKECEFISYHNAEHWFGAWSNEQLQDFWTRVLDWFEEHLTSEPPR